MLSRFLACTCFLAQVGALVWCATPQYGVVLSTGFESFFGYHLVRLNSIDLVSDFCSGILSTTTYTSDKVVAMPPTTEQQALILACYIEALAPVRDPITNVSSYRSGIDVQLDIPVLEGNLQPLTDFLVSKLAYVKGVTLVHDYRDDLFSCVDPSRIASFQANVEKAASASLSGKAIVIAVCGGSICTSTMLQLVDSGWKQKYVHRFVSVIAPLGGAPSPVIQLLQTKSSMQGLFSGFFSLFGSIDSIVSMSLLNPLVFPAYGVYYFDNGQSYGSQNYCDLFGDILDLPELSAVCEAMYHLRVSSLSWNPDVPVTAIWTVLTDASTSSPLMATDYAPYFVSRDFKTIISSKVIGDNWISLIPASLVSRWIAEGVDGDVHILEGSNAGQYQHGYGVLTISDVQEILSQVLTS
eukprot:ANDGO_08431.mRNA.1 hypothetical protein